MNRLAMTLATASLTACASAPQTLPPPAAPAPTPQVQLGTGLDAAGFDRTVRPQDDLFRFVNGKWLETTEIPADRSNYGAFVALDDQAQADVRAVVEEAANAPARAPGSDAQKIGDFYLSFMDVERANRLGLEPLAPELARIEALADRKALNGYFGTLQQLGIAHPIWLYIAQDEKNTTVYIPYVYQRGLTLPDRDYYLKSDEKFVAIRAKYLAYVTQVLGKVGVADAAAAAQRIVALETRLAEAHWTRVQNRDAVATYNKYSIDAANKLTPGFDWSAFFAGAQVPPQDFVVTQPSFFTALGAALTEIPVADWKVYLKFKLVNGYAPYLDADLVAVHFDLHGRTLKGIAENRPRWKRAIEAIDDTMGEIAGRLYVEKHFTPDAKKRMDELVANLLEAFHVSIDELDWMGPATKQEAQKKLAAFTVKIGYPSKWKDYSALTIRKDDLVGNMLRSAAVEHARAAGKLGRPVDRTEWLMTPQTVNAYYYPPMNEIVFPAAILHPPFFNVAADDATNYGAIGAVIGHEISHGFDDQGRKYDGQGNLRDWWTAEDGERFKQRAAKLTAQYSGYSPLEGMNVNGELTLGENIGDLSGLAVAYKAYQLSLHGQPAPVIDGFSGDQRFFMGWSQVWRRKYREEDLRSRLMTDPHSPSEYRCNGIVTNMNEFYRAFDLKPGDKLYRPPEERVEIW
jgi:predicted metalloendopeptidase